VDEFSLNLIFEDISKICGQKSSLINPLNAKLNPICHLLALLEAHNILHVSRIRVNTDKNNGYVT
jgi:hypothetical protein